VEDRLRFEFCVLRLSPLTSDPYGFPYISESNITPKSHNIS
jgi:hypothetical protein